MKILRNSCLEFLRHHEDSPEILLWIPEDSLGLPGNSAQNFRELMRIAKHRTSYYNDIDFLMISNNL